MSNVSISTDKLDNLANSIAMKSGASIPLTLDQMKTAVDSIVTGGSGGITPTGTINITTNGTHDVTNYASANVNVSSGSPTLQSKTATPTESAQTITADSGYDGLSSVAVGAIDSGYIGSGVTRISNNSGITINGNTVSVRGQAYYTGNVSKTIPLQSKTVTPTESTQTVTADSNYSGLSSVEIGAISSTYVGSGITRRSSSDLNNSTTPGTIIVPAGYYEEQASKGVGTGNAGTPIATKGTVSNHSISVTPSTTTTAGYISAGTKTGTAVTVSASELVSGSETKTANDTYDVTNLAELVVNVPTGTARSSSDLTVSGATVTVPAGLYSSQATKSVASGSAGTPTATKGTVSNHSITVTPSVTNTTGYITGGTKSGTGVTVSASELVSGSQTITENGNNIDVTNLASVNVAISYSTITVSSSNPSGGNNGDIWIKR